MMNSFSLMRMGVLLALCQPAVAQHCAPVMESYLSEIALKKSEEILNLQLTYTIEGGAGQDAYQAYLVAYLERDSAKVPASSPEDFLNPAKTFVIGTQLVKRNEDGDFDFDFVVDGNELAKNITAHRGLAEGHRIENGSWQIYQDRLRIAVFVPWLDDKKYSVIAGLPEKRHCCNYTNAPALLFQTLPYRLTMRSTMIESVEHFRLGVNGERTPLGGWLASEESQEEEQGSANEQPLEEEAPRVEEEPLAAEKPQTSSNAPSTASRAPTHMSLPLFGRHRMGQRFLSCAPLRFHNGA